MKFTYGSLEIEIKAKYKGAKRSSEELTMDVMHELICNLLSASEYANMKGCPLVAESKKKKWMELFDQLEAKGYYNK